MIGVIDLQNISYRNVDARGLITGFQFLQVTFFVLFLEIFMHIKMPIYMLEKMKK